MGGTFSTPSAVGDRLDAPAQLITGLAGRYNIGRVLGTGGMATVYLAHDVRHGRDVALKVLRSDIAYTIGSERFIREIRLAASLSHPHILPLFDSGGRGGRPLLCDAGRRRTLTSRSTAPGANTADR